MTREARAKTGAFLWATIVAALLTSAVANIGSAMVASAWTDTRAEVVESLPQLCASSRLDPDAPPKCGTSVTIWSAHRCPPTSGL